MVDALVPVRRKRVDKRPSDAHRGRAERDRLEHVVGAAHAAVDEELEALIREGQPTLAPELAHDLDEHLEAGARELKLAPAVVREHDAGEARVVREQRVLPALHALEDERHCAGAAAGSDRWLGRGKGVKGERLTLRNALEPGDVLPVEAWVDK